MTDEPKGIQEMLRDYVSLAHRCMGWGASEEDRRACRDSYEALDSEMSRLAAELSEAREDTRRMDVLEERYRLTAHIAPTDHDHLCISWPDAYTEFPSVRDAADTLLKSSVVPVESSSFGEPK